MRVRAYGPGDYREMPWKNGGGSTTELLIEPPGANLAGGFRWRVSTATVAESGPFSCFPGCDRTLLLLTGQGLELDHGAHGRALLSGPLEPVAFSGDWATRGRLLAGPCRDFNVMSRRDEVLHDVTIINAVRAPSALPEAPTVLVFCARGTVSVISAGGALRAGELLRIDAAGAPGLTVTAADGTARLVVVAIRPRHGPDSPHK
jgi:environmental stress-induced protein Ves